MKYYVICTDCITRIFDNVEEFRKYFRANRDKILFYRVGK